MADIRINALATTAASTASDDFIAVDGSANGTRKLNAYSPTFGGDLTVSGNISLTSNTSLIQFPSTTDLPKIQLFSTTYGLGIDNTDAVFFAGSGGGIRFKADSVSGTQWGRINGSGLSLTGNLTVSGTGGFGNTVSITKAGGAILELNDSNQTARIRTVETGATHDLAFWAESAEKMRLKGANGNLLIGTTTDGGQKLQVIGDVSVLASGSTIASFGRTATSPANAGWSAGADNDGGYISTLQIAKFRIFTGGTTALTLDSSQNATFAGTVTLATAGVSSTGSNSLIFTGADGNGNVRTPAKIIGKHAGNGGYGNLVFQTAFNNSLVDALTLDASQNATFAGAIAIGNTVQTAVAVASTHKVTISIGGTTYYLLATNV